MKHNIRITIELLLWTAAALAFGVIVSPNILLQEAPPIPFSPLIFVFIIFGMLLLAAYIWLKLFKKLKPDTLVAVFSGGVGAIMYRAITALFPLKPMGAILSIIVSLSIIWICSFSFYYLIRLMQKSWRHTRRWYPVINIIMAVILPVVAVIMSKGMPLWAALLLLFLAACYDAYAVWKSKHMITLAKTFVKLRMLPGIIVPRKQREQFAILGGGDIFFISFVSASAFPCNGILPIVISIGGFAAILFLFVFSRKKRFYPALPFILIGILLSIVIWWWFI